MNVLNAAIYSRLQTTSAITSLLAGTTAIYNMQAPEGQAYPYIVFNLQGGGDVNDTQNRLKNLIVFVRTYTQGGVGAAQGGSIDAQVDTALHLNPLTVSGWTNIWLAREQDIELVGNDPTGQRYYTTGGLYRVMIDKD
jgi:uncharacterized protein DUF3168